MIFDGALKFGSSIDPNVRLRQVELASGRVNGELRVWGPLQGFRGIERDIHNKIKSKSICGEWYNPDAINEILDEIDSNEEMFGGDIDLALERAEIESALSNARHYALSMFVDDKNMFGDVIYNPINVDCGKVADTCIEIYAALSRDYAERVKGARAYFISELIDCDRDTSERIASVWNVGKDEFMNVLFVLVMAIGLTAVARMDEALELISSAGRGLGADAEKWLVGVVYGNNINQQS